MHWHLNISINSKVLLFTHKNFIDEIKLLVILVIFTYDHCNSCAQLFGTSITLLQLLISIYYLFFHPSRGICWCFLKTIAWIFRAHIHYQHFKKISFSENFGKLSSKTFILESFIQVHLLAFLVYERPLALKGSRPFQRCKIIMPTLKSIIDGGVEQQGWLEKISETNSRGNWNSSGIGKN